MKKAYLAAFFAIVFWGTTFAVGKLVTPVPLNSISFTMIRTIFGGLVLLLYLGVTHQIQAWIEILKRYRWQLLCLGAFGFTLSYILQYWALSMTTATNQSIISNTQTFWVVILNFIVFHRKPKAIFVIGAILAFIGVILVIFNGELGVTPVTLKGDLLSILTFFSWGAYTTFTKPLSMKEKSIFITSGIIFWAMIFVIPFGVLSNAFVEMQLLTAAEWGIMLYLGVVCVAGSFILWNYALSDKNVHSENIALFTLLNPVVGIFFAVILLGEVITWQIIGGIILIIVGLIIAQHSPNSNSTASPH